MENIGEVHWSINFLHEDEDGEWVYALVAPTTSVDIDPETQEITYGEKSDSVLLRGTMRECLDFLITIDDYEKGLMDD